MGQGDRGVEERKREGRGMKRRIVDERKERFCFTMYQVQEHGCWSHRR